MSRQNPIWTVVMFVTDIRPSSLNTYAAHPLRQTFPCISRSGVASIFAISWLRRKGTSHETQNLVSAASGRTLLYSSPFPDGCCARSSWQFVSISLCGIAGLVQNRSARLSFLPSSITNASKVKIIGPIVPYTPTLAPSTLQEVRNTNDSLRPLYRRTHSSDCSIPRTGTALRASYHLVD